MALLHFTANRPADDPTAIHSACHFDQTDESNATTTAGQENPRPLRLSSSTTASSPNASLNPILTSPEHSRILTDLSPSNPAILLARSSTDPDPRPFVCAAITIVSSARTMELYISGEYSGTFRGESFLPSDPSFTPVISGPGGTGGGPASPPLFLIQIDQESLLHRCRNLVFKFFIPKKPTAFQDSLSLHWLIVQGALPPPSPSFSLSNHGPTSQNSPRQPATATSPSPTSPWASLSSTSTQPGNPPSLTQTDTTGATISTAANNVDPTATTTTAYNDVSTTPASHISSGYFTSSSQNFENQTSPNFSAFASAHPYMMSPGISTSIDLDKVRQMLSQVQIDNMPQGAKDLMRNMEMQSLAQQQQLQQRTAASSVAAGEYLSPSPLASPLPPLPPPSSSSTSLPPPPTVTSILIPPSELATVAAAAGETAAFVTKAELALMEERIMTKIEQQFQEMEDRILNKLLLATKLPNA